MKKRSYSLTVQLAALFAVCASLVFAAVGFYLLQALTTQLRERDDVNLIDRTAFIRHLLEETESAKAVSDDPHRFLDAVDLQSGLALEMRDVGGHLLAQNTSVAIPVAPASTVAISRTPLTGDVRDAVASDGSQMRVLHAVGRVGEGSDIVRITLAHSVDGRAALLSVYRMKVFLAVAFGAALTAFMGYIVTRRSLQRVTALAAQARAITVENLQLRLNREDVPSELRVLADAFNDVLSRLEGGFENLSQFSADLAHDLRTPLNNLMVQTQVALSQARACEEYQELLTSHYEEYERMVRMVETMLFLARADHDEIALTTSALDASVELHQIAEYFEGPALDAGLEMTVTGSGTVIADVILFRRAVGNLVSNALRYTPYGQAIELNVSAYDKGTVVTVSNPGTGIDERDLPRLFDRFYRSDKSRASSERSAGLGLAIVKSIMQLHGGKATVSSTEKRVAFRLFFPRNGRT
jgi:two-component system heavy metal sensor histidine kinase CusS